MFFFAYVAARAVRVPLTYDEAATYLRYIASDVPSVFSPSLLSVFNFEVATNHFLNTLLAKVCSLIAGDSELVLRIPNLIGYALYMYFSLLILQRLTRPAIAIAGFMLLNLNPYVLDFFALSRGYGLSLGLLMGALHFFFTSLERLRTGEDRAGDAWRPLLLACAAVAANFSLLTVYLALFLVLLVALAAFNVIRPERRHNPTENPRSYRWLALAAPLFVVLVLSQDIRLSEDLYEPVAVRLVGLDAPELVGVRVAGVDLRGRGRPLARAGDTPVWRSTRGAHVRAVRIELPRSAADKIARIELIAGDRTFWHDPERSGAWTSHDAGAMRVFESGPAISLPKSRMPAFRPLINWAGDTRFVARVGARTALALASLAGLAGVLYGLGALAARRNLLTRDQWRPLAAGILALAALAGPPVYLLKRNAELYYGGNAGLVHDTFYSVIANSFYGRQYHPAQTQLAFGIVLTTLAAFVIVLYVNWRRRQAASMLPGVSLLAIMTLVAAAVVAQRFLFHTPYLLGRTALFYIPLYWLFVALLCQTIAAFGRAGTIAATSVLATALSLSIYHFTATANLKYALDWRNDASTKWMMHDLQLAAGADGRAGARVVLGVDPVYAPVAVYYARRTGPASIEVVAPPPSHSDFLYVDERNAGRDMPVVARYRLTHTVLARAD